MQIQSPHHACKPSSIKAKPLLYTNSHHSSCLAIWVLATQHPLFSYWNPALLMGAHLSLSMQHVWMGPLPPLPLPGLTIAILAHESSDPHFNPHD